MKCIHCDGAGWLLTQVPWRLEQPPSTESDPCPHCFEIGQCPQCSALLDECDEDGHNVCHVCGWSSLTALNKMLEARHE